VTRDTIERFKGALIRRRDVLLDWVRADNTCNGQECDPQIIASLEGAIHKIHHGTFGECRICHGDVEPSRLALDYTASICLECLSEMDRRTLERELEMAAEVQRNLLPRDVPSMDGIEVAVRSQPAGIVGGDYFDFVHSPDGTYTFVVGDVMGKGLPASMLMSSLQASLRILCPEHDDLAELAKRLNTLFRHNLSLIRFITLILVRVDPKEGVICYLNAGHNPALLWSIAHDTGTWLAPTGPAIGLVKDPEFRVERLPIETGDTLLMYTDGLVEARDSKGDEFGTSRLVEFVAGNQNLTAERFISDLRDAAVRHAGVRPHDDITLMALRPSAI